MNLQLKAKIDQLTPPYSEDELCQIGVAHKAVPQGERNWQELADYLGLEKTGEQYRQWTNYRLKQQGELPIQVEQQEAREEDPILTLKRERIKTRDAVNSYRRYLREDARLETIVEAIGDAASRLQLPLVSYKAPRLVEAQEREAVLLYSDLHIGVDCHNFYNTYNQEVAARRVGKLASEAIRYCKQNGVQRLHILNLGDLIHGAIHTDSRIEQEQDVIDQVILAAQLTAQFLNEMQAAAPEVVYRSCSDNHARISANKVESIASENFGRLIDFYLEAALAGTKIQFAEDNLDYGLGRFILDNGKVCMFAHGHQDILNQVWQGYIGASKEFVDYIFMGHLHNAKLKSYQGTKVIVNGSICGTEQYALSKRLFGDAEQTLMIFDQENVVQYLINLQRA